MYLRITVLLDKQIAKQLRRKQAKAVKTLQKSISFSKIINQTLIDCLKIKKRKSNLI